MIGMVKCLFDFSLLVFHDTAYIFQSGTELLSVQGKTAAAFTGDR